jgi:hypothetical protein
MQIFRLFKSKKRLEGMNHAHAEAGKNTKNVVMIYTGANPFQP